MYQFASGNLLAVPNGGNMTANPTPVQFGVIKSVAIDFNQDLKELRGIYQFPDDVAPGNRKVTLKAEFGRIEGKLFNNLLFGDTQTTGGTVAIVDEAHSVPAATPYTVVVTNITGLIDFGVRYSATGNQLERVTTTPTQGQYSVAASTGTYTFSAADEGVGVMISYTYTQTVSGITYEMNQQFMGYGPTFMVAFNMQYTKSTVATGMQGNLIFFAVKSSKLSMPTKQDDYQIATLDMEAFANPAGQVCAFFGN